MSIHNKRSLFCVGIYTLQDSLHALMATLGSANPFFVRCIKPNVQKKPDQFEHQVVLNQLKYSGKSICTHVCACTEVAVYQGGGGGLSSSFVKDLIWLVVLTF